jgi:serine/threonine protein kinase
MRVNMGVNEPGGASGGTMNAVLPEQFGKYSLIGHLATGGMAEVWLARQVGLEGFEKTVVIKRARPELTDRETTRRFLDEARLVATLEHPNIAQVYEIGFVSGSYFFVMEYVDGADLRRLIQAAIAKRYPISFADALYILTQVCAALHYAHEKHDLEGNPLRIIHRDVSPSNVLISHDGVVKVCDFGVAKAQVRKAGDTKSGVVKGKFSYMSPEQCQSRPLDRRSDVFSIGILLYELTTLSKLFRARTEYDLLQQVVEARIPPPSTRVPGYPRELEQIVMKALARDPEDRYPTAQALQLDLEDFARERKLAMSSIGIAMLMKTLIEKRNNIRARGSRPRVSDMMEAEAGSERFAFLADGSAPSANQPEVSRMTPNPQSVVAARSNVSVIAEAPGRRTAGLWLVGALIAVIIAVAVSVADQMAAGAEDRAMASSLTADAERIASVFDAAARAAQLRANGIATTPMLRAAIETDAATLTDLATNEMVFTAGQGESMELFRMGKGKPASLLRIPKSAPPLPPPNGRDSRFRSDGLGVTLTVSAPISGYREGLAGAIAIAGPVDLSAVRRSLVEHTVGVSLLGLGSELMLVDHRGGAGGPPVELTIPAMGAWTTGTAKLIATPKRAPGLSWAGPARYAAGGLAVLLLIGFAVNVRKKPQLVELQMPPQA